MGIGRQMSALRNTRQWTQQQVADRLGISRGSYSQYEMDNREPSFAVAMELANLYQVSIDYLVRGHNRENKNENQNEHEILKDEFCNWIEDYIGAGLYRQFLSLSPVGRMWVIDELDTFITLEERRESLKKEEDAQK